MSTALPSPQDQGQHQDPTLPPSLPPAEFQSRASVDVTATADGTLAHSHAEGSASDGAGAGAGAGGVAQKGGEDEDEVKDSERQANNLPWSPPLTRSNTGESVRRERQGAERGDEQSPSVAADPLPAETEEEHEHGFTPTVAEEHAPVGEEALKPRATVTRQASRIDLDAKLEPQPWDLVDPPETNNAKTNGEYYSSLKGQKYNTLTSPRRARSLIPKSSYYFGPPPSDSAYGTPPVGQIGLHHPREILRVERDYSGGELIQFAPIYPLELEGRITPTQFLESINAINEVLISAHSLRYSFLDNMLAVFTLQLSRVFLTAHYEKEMRRLQELIHELNSRVYNPAGLNILWPRRVAFLFMEIEYYV
ncbi:Golgin subfamily A member 7/ERF4 family-domain-containing protein, partial [Mycena pura]